MHRLPQATQDGGGVAAGPRGRGRARSSRLRSPPRASSRNRAAPVPIKVNQQVSELDIPGFVGGATDDAGDSGDVADHSDYTSGGPTFYDR